MEYTVGVACKQPDTFKVAEILKMEHLLDCETACFANRGYKSATACCPNSLGHNLRVVSSWWPIGVNS